MTLQSRELAPPRWLALLRGAVVLAIWIAAVLLLHRYFLSLVGESGPFYSKILLDIGISIILAVSLNIVNGFTGQFSIGHAGFMLTGGYIAAAITFYGTVLIWGDKQFHGGFLSCSDNVATYVGPWIAGGDVLFLAACLLGGVAAAIAGYVVGLPSLRLRGDYLAIVTLGFGEIVRVLFQNSGPQVTRVKEIKETPVWKLTGALGESLGMTGVPFYTSLFWVYFFVAIMLIVAFRLKQSSAGRALISIREDEVAAEAMGVMTTRYKVRAFVISAFFAGIAGSLYAHMLGSINAGELGFMKSFDVVIMVVLGGMGSISGVVLAAVLLTVLPEYLRDPQPIWWLALPLAGLVLLSGRMRAWYALAAFAGCIAVFETANALFPVRVLPEYLPGFGLRELLWTLLIVGLAAVYRGPEARRAIWIVVAAIGVEILRWMAKKYEVNLADFRMIIYALLLIIMMIVRPQGLFGIHEIWDLFRRSSARARI